MLQLYKLSNTDISTLVKEKASLEKSITTLEGILSDRKKLDRVLIRDLKEIAAKYGTPRRTQIVEKDINLTIDKRDLIAKEEVIITVTRDGYIKRSTIKSYRGSGLASMPGLKEDDILVYRGQAMTTDFMLVFTNLGNYLYIPIHEIIDTKWREEGKHISYLISLENKEKIICAFAVQKFRDDLYLMLVSKKGQIKRVALDQFVVVRYARPILAMKLLKDDELVDVVLTNGNNNVLVLTSSGGSLLINENEVSTASLRSGGVKVVSELKKDLIVKLLTFDLEEKAKIALLTHAGHVRIYDYLNTPISSRLSKATPIYPCFKNDLHRLIYAVKIKPSDKEINLQVQANNKQVTTITIDDFYITPRNRYARANVTLPRRSHLNIVFREDDILIDKKIVALKPPLKEEEIKVENLKEAKKKDYEQISIFEDDENK
jgi:topoisomerase-4 subunit A